ncbi:hypothetical protein BaRGS_00030941 [Batillaria attramentaria]|uniref:Uncharacterized protein n=1 Tax=Batillaria attramentaria TaxID=370345 RepID=A0ABD0JRN1_9CAEN
MSNNLQLYSSKGSGDYCDAGGGKTTTSGTRYKHNVVPLIPTALTAPTQSELSQDVAAQSSFKKKIRSGFGSEPPYFSPLVQAGCSTCELVSSCFPT